ncbi:MAG: DUF4974 domain-containing protein, partial [Bacteroidota bacterium]
DIDLDTSLAWRDNQIFFNDTPFLEAITILERWFNVQIDLENHDQVADCYVSGKFENESLVNILDGLKFLKGFDYHKVSEDQFLITNNPCSRAND